MKSTKIILTAFLVFIVTSCKKYLDIKSDKSLVVPTTLSDFQALLDDAQLMNLQTPSFGEASTDDYYILNSRYNSRPQRLKHVYTWRYHDFFYPNDWSDAYTAVYYANLCLEGIDKIAKENVNEGQWNNIRGSALFYRAYNFLNLAWVHSHAYDPTSSTNDLGIVLRLSADFNQVSKRASVAETYEKILTDAKEAAYYLPMSAQHVIRPSRIAAHALIARTYLSMRRYDSAWKYADMALQQYSELMDFNNSSEVDIFGSPPFKPFNKEIIFFSEMNLNTGLQIPAIAKIDNLLYSSYEDNDLRKTAYFIPSSGWRFKGSYSENPDLFFTGIATDELFLIRAECYARKGELANALNDINVLLAKRYDNTFSPVTASNASEALSRILLERRKELLMRGLRWIDIKRLNKEGANIVLTRTAAGQTYTLQPNANYYALPLPKDIIDLTGMLQNPQ